MIARARPQLRPYQVAGVQRLRESFRRFQTVLCVLPTGGGKTVVAAWLIDSAVAHGNRVLFLAHRTELIDQASRKLDEFGVEHGVIQAHHGRQDLSHPVQVASVQTLVRRLPRLHRHTFDLIVVDEAHHTAAGSYQTILQAYPNAKVLGLTATPYRLDGDGLGDSFDHLEALATVPELIGSGYLVPTRTFAPAPPQALADIHSRGGDFRADEAAEVLDQVGPVAEIVSTWQARAAGRLTVAFGSTVQHANRIAMAFRDAGITAAAIDGETPAGERAAALADLAAGKLQVIANCGLLTEGWDLPACAAVVLARPTKSRALWRQMVGRGMRSAADKADCLILDHAANVARFGCPDEADVYSLLHAVPDEYALGGYLLCPSCCALCRVTDARCGECRAPLPQPREERDDDSGRSRRDRDDERNPRPIIERQAMELAETRPLTTEERRDRYFDWLTEAASRGWKLGWAAHRYKERFGCWPETGWMHDWRASAGVTV